MSSAARVERASAGQSPAAWPRSARERAEAGWARPDGAGIQPPPSPRLRVVDGRTRRPSPAVLRRRRLIAVVLLAVGLLASWRLVGATLGSTASAGGVDEVPVVLVAQPGDTYWSLAAQVHDGGDVRSTVDALVRANGGDELRAGDRIRLGS